MKQISSLFSRFCLLNVLAAALSTGGCLVVEPTYDKIPAGVYRGVFYLDGRLSQRKEPDRVAANFNLDEVRQAELPVMLEVTYAEDSTLRVTFVNADERIEATDVEFRRLITSAKDSITIRFPLNDSYITGYHESGVIEGEFVDESRADYRIPFAAFYGIGYRFTDLEKPVAADLTGRWSAQFGLNDTSDTYDAIAEFRQRGNVLTGTFLTATGDYRFLEGTVQGDRFYLSTFDGGHVFLFAGKIQPDSSLLGIFRSGNHYQSIWAAQRNADAALPDAETQTKVKTLGAVDPEVYDAEQKQSIRLSEVPQTEGKYKLVTLLGSWCPNCRDESVFLDSLRQNLTHADRLAVVGLAYERFRDTTRAVAAVARFRESLQLGFPIYLAGFADKAEATERLGFLDEVKSFPTMLLLDPRQNVIYTHTGFTGPATAGYGAFAKTFAAKLDQLLAP